MTSAIARYVITADNFNKLFSGMPITWYKLLQIIRFKHKQKKKSLKTCRKILGRILPVDMNQMILFVNIKTWHETGICYSLQTILTQHLVIKWIKLSQLNYSSQSDVFYTECQNENEKVFLKIWKYYSSGQTKWNWGPV